MSVQQRRSTHSQLWAYFLALVLDYALEGVYKTS